MISRIKKHGEQVRAHISPENLLKAIRNRKGHRPLAQDRQGGDLLVASYNIHKCVGTDNQFDPQRIVRVISEINADILALQEADRRFGERIGLIDLNHLKAETGLEAVPINTMSPHGLGWHGNALFIRNGQVKNVHQIKLPGIEPRGALIAELEFTAGPIRVIAAHFGLLRHSRNQQAKTILSLIEKSDHMPTIMIGDLNEWRIGKGSSLSNLVPYFDVTSGTVPSFPSRFPVLALDRVFAYPQELVAAIQCHTTPLSRIASDHLPIKARIDLKNAVAAIKDKANRAILSDQQDAK